MIKNELVYYDIYPKVVPCGRATRVHVRALSCHARFEEDKEWFVYIIPAEKRARRVKYPDYPVMKAQNEGGAISFEFTYDREQQYNIWISDKYVTENTSADWKDARRVQLSVYAVEDDLLALRPLRGNFHIHSCRSDGVESPEVVAAMYRRFGYDFMALTDHHQYQPSLEAIAAYKDTDIDMKLFPGEEVHSPDNLIHVVHFAGDYSVNDVYRADEDGYYKAVAEIEKTIDVPEHMHPFEIAATKWVCEQIKKANGLSMLCHPNWTYWGAYNQSVDTFKYFMAHRDYDVLELINGGNEPFENQLQAATWYNFPNRPVAVGADDSHGSVNGKWFDIGKTYVLAKSMEREDIFSALRGGMCCAVEQYHGENARIYGDERMVRFFTWLDAEYFPLHDELCVEEGRLMMAYVNGDETAKARIALCHGQTERLHKHLFAEA